MIRGRRWGGVARRRPRRFSAAWATGAWAAARGCSAARATSAAEGRLRALLAERLEVDLSLTAVRTRTPFFGRLEVWPDIVIAE
ncbi:MAG: hypothetical protein ACKOHK_01700, partial [Planctomycetia bacterium]